MASFWMIAAFMTVVAVGFLAWPILRARSAYGSWSTGGIAVAVLLVPAAVLLYRDISTWSGTTAATQANTEQLEIVEQLAAKMQENPNDVEGWILLGRSYLSLEQFVPARQALLQAWQRSDTHSNDLKLALGIAMVHSDPASLGTDAGQLIEEVVTAEPNNMQALWYGGMAALERGRSDLARDRWVRLLSMGPPAEVARVIEAQIAQLGSMPAFAGGGAPSAAPGGGAPGAAAAPNGGASAPGPVIALHVAFGEGFSAANVGPNAALFIFARAQAGGPPLAVIRQPASAVPGDFTLSNANVMIQGNSLENFEQIRLVARLSQSGQPTEQAGDIYAETLYDVKTGGAVTLTLDQVVR